MSTTEKKSMQRLWQESYLANDSYLENMYDTYLKHPDQISPEWRDYFNQLAHVKPDISHEDIRKALLQKKRERKQPAESIKGADLHQMILQEKVSDLISAYRQLGHLQAKTDPLGLQIPIEHPTLNLAYYGLTESDMDRIFNADALGGLPGPNVTLRTLYQQLRKIYTGSIGFEYMHIFQQEEVDWLKQRIEHHWPNGHLTPDEKKDLLKHLVAADGLEKYLGNKYVAQKRFSLEGGDSLIPLLHKIIQQSARSDVKECVIGMAHRGRLNVLVNVLGKEPEEIFAGFEGRGIKETHSGDVKYHMGFSSDLKTDDGYIHLVLAFNPSHLEIVSPVVQGSVRSRQRRRRDTEQKQVVPIFIHGDAAFAGQGVVMETFSLSQARWFKVGGSIHIVVNNQVGFTISDPQDARSSLYCTDIAKMVQAPIIHVNADDPEAVLFVAQLAVDYRQRFKKDIVIDLMCYRRHGHNEADEPSATQPIMYQAIKSLPQICSSYAKKLVADGVIDETVEPAYAEAYRAQLENGKSLLPLLPKGTSEYEFSTKWDEFLGTEWTVPGKTAVPMTQLKKLAKQMEILPEGFIVQPQVKKMLEARAQMTDGEMPLNWGYAETLAYATLLEEGYPIRLCGQDACRGTFAHRHAVLHDQKTNSLYIPLSHLSPQQAQINIVDSLLSEEAVLAFEYGYATAEPNNLVIWEAQFGDFANGAQVVIDQFISSGEQKWGRLCGLVMLLPHGYEGMGPEHTSARLERYLQLCAQQNMQICIPTSPAQIFHLLRRQMVRPYRKPLIVLTPKSLLRHPMAVSALKDLSEGEFQTVIPEMESVDMKALDRIILCSGKVYYDLLEKRRKRALKNSVIIRIEQLYPFPEADLKKVLQPYTAVKRVIWCQEEPLNQGAWYSSQHHFIDCLGREQKLEYVGRPASASPAVGYLSVHQKEQDQLVNHALEG